MKIYDENKNYVGKIEKPEPIEQDGKWWEPIIYREPLLGEHYYYYATSGKSVINECFRAKDEFYPSLWIVSEIPRATPEQLRAIGMKERDGRPVICKENDTVWIDNEHEFIGLPRIGHLGHYRFVLEPDAQNEVHASCRECRHSSNPSVSGPCVGCWNVLHHPHWQARQPQLDILERLRKYNLLDRTLDVQREIAVQEAVDEIERLRKILKV